MLDSPANIGVGVVQVAGGEMGRVVVAREGRDWGELANEKRVWGWAHLRREGLG